jgi:hypothetical protein
MKLRNHGSTKPLLHWVWLDRAVLMSEKHFRWTGNILLADSLG